MELTEEKINGYIFTPRIAKKEFKCCVSGHVILIGEQYFAVVMGSGGMSWVAHPDRIKIECKDAYLEKWGIVFGRQFADTKHN